jgi:hypothetical protein
MNAAKVGQLKKSGALRFPEQDATWESWIPCIYRNPPIGKRYE